MSGEFDSYVRARYMCNLWRWACGMSELPTEDRQWTVEERERNWFPAFIELMRNRMRLGIYRYAYFRDPEQAAYDRMSSAIARLRLFQKEGNAEHLVDVANLCGIEFERRDHPNWHFEALDDVVHTEAK